MFCTRCGKEIPDGSKFCNNCGMSFVPQPVTPQPQKKQNKVVLIVLIVIGVLVFLGVGSAIVRSISFPRSVSVQDKKESEVSVSVTKKWTTPQDLLNGVMFDYVCLEIQATNNTSKPIKGIEGSLTIYDLFGKKIKRYQCDLTGQTISPGFTVVYSDWAFSANPFIESEMKIYNSDFSDLNFEYEIKTIAYAE